MNSILLRSSAFRWLQRTCTAAALLVGTATALAQALPGSWASRPIEGGNWYQPTDLQPNTMINIWAPPAVAVGTTPITQAFVQVKQQHGLRGINIAGLQPNCEDARQTPEGVTQTCRLEGAGKMPLNVYFVMLPIRNGNAHMLRVLSSGDSASLEKHKEGVGAILKIETQRWKNN